MNSTRDKLLMEMFESKNRGKVASRQDADPPAARLAVQSFDWGFLREKSAGARRRNKRCPSGHCQDAFRLICAPKTSRLTLPSEIYDDYSKDHIRSTIPKKVFGIRYLFNNLI